MGPVLHGVLALFGPPRQLTALPKRLDRLTGLRWFAAFGVFLVHTYLLVKAFAPWYARSAEAGSAAGVTFFFMLSGLVLSWSRTHADDKAAFWRNRFARIYPLHLAALGAALALPRLIDHQFISKSHVIPQIALLQAWIPSKSWYFAPNIVAWTLSCEAFFYLLFPWLYRGVMALKRPVAALGVLIGIVWLVPVASFAVPASRVQWATYIFPLARLPEFCIGIVLCRLIREGRVRWTNQLIPAALVIVAIGSARWIPARFIQAAWAAIPLAWLLAAAANSGAAGAKSWLEQRWLVVLGEISFALYLTHALVATWLPRLHVLRHGVLGRPKALFVVILGVSMVVAAALHYLLERPLERVLRAPRSQPATSTAAGTS